MLVNLPFEQEIFAIAKGLYGPVIKEAILTHLRGIIVPETGKYYFTTAKTEGSIELTCEYPREAYDPEYWQPGNEWVEAFIDFEFEGLMGPNYNNEENTTVLLTYKGTQIAKGGTWRRPATINMKNDNITKRFSVNSGLTLVPELSTDTLVFRSTTENYTALITIEENYNRQITAEIKLEH